MRGLIAVLGRELRASFSSTLAWAVLTLFLLVQGYSFYLYVQLMSQPGAPHGAAMQLFFGGSFLYWLFVIVVVSALTMRLVAEERRSGTLETLLAAPVREGAVVGAKYLGAVLFYGFLWSPTLVYVIVVARLSGEQGGLGVGAVASGYLGTLLCGAACIAVGLLASALARSQIVAALLTFALLSLLLLLAPLELFVSGALKAVLGRLNLFDQMDDFARGIVDSRHIVFHLSLIVFCLTAATRALRPHPLAGSLLGGRLRGRARVALGLTLLALNLVLANVLAARHYARGDWTRAGIHELSPRTLATLASLTRPVTLSLFMVPPDRQRDSLYHETSELARRFAAGSPLVRVETIDMDADLTRAELLAKKHNVSGADLREGVVVVEAAGRSKYVAASAMADYQVSERGRRMVAFKGEGALLGALTAVTSGRATSVCFLQGHGEASPESFDPAGYGQIADEVKRDGYRVRTAESGELVAGLAGCQIAVLGGPVRVFAAVEIDALDRYLRRGGRMLLLSGPVLDRRVTRFGELGIEAWLKGWGVELRNRIVVDPLAVPGEQPLLTWATEEGYATDHPIGRAMQGRLTVWPLAREVRPVTPPRSLDNPRASLSSVAIVRSSAAGWAESDLASLRGDRPLRADPGVDTGGPVSVGVAVSWQRTRIVAFGSERGVLNNRLAGSTQRDHNRDLFLAALAWLDPGGDRAVAVGPKTPEHLRLLLDEKQLGRLFLVTVVAMPGTSLLLGLLVWRRRRR
jgi:ABC-2 type transport system permease protein